MILFLYFLGLEKSHIFFNIKTTNQEFLQQEHPYMKILHCPLQNFGGGDGVVDEGDNGGGCKFSIT